MRLRIDAVTVRFGGAAAADGVTLAVAPGETVGLVGPNGSGKTTVLRTVYRALRPDAGLVEVGGGDVWRLTARAAARRTAAVLQQDGGGFDFEVAELVALGRHPHRRPGGAGRGDDAAVGAALRRAGVAHLAHRLVGTLSGGERQRVLLARALAQEPRLLVLDEPTNHLDPAHRLDLLGLLRGLGVAVLVCLHDLDLAAAWCDQVVVLDRGRVVAVGPPEATLTAGLLREVFRVDAVPVRHPRTGRLHLLLDRLDGAHGPDRLDEVTGRPDRFEDHRTDHPDDRTEVAGGRLPR